MRCLFLLSITITFILCKSLVLGQNHVQWTTQWSKEKQTVILTGKIDPNWHLYSPETDPNLGPIALSVKFSKHKGLKLLGKTVFKPKATQHFDENFGGQVFTWENEITIEQSFRLKNKVTISIILNYMACDETQCLPPIDKTFTLTLEK